MTMERKMFRAFWGFDRCPRHFRRIDNTDIPRADVFRHRSLFEALDQKVEHFLACFRIPFQNIVIDCFLVQVQGFSLLLSKGRFQLTLPSQGHAIFILQGTDDPLDLCSFPDPQRLQLVVKGDNLGVLGAVTFRKLGKLFLDFHFLLCDVLNQEALQYLRDGTH